MQLASDLHTLIHSHLQITAKIHIVGHDIGGMVAWAYAAQYPDDVQTLTWGECPLPGTTFYDKIKGKPEVFHFVFHQVRDLPEALIAGREDIYLKHFFDQICYSSAAIGREDLDVYVRAFRQPGAVRAGLELYRAFEEDKVDNLRVVGERGRVGASREGQRGIPVLGMFGKEFLLQGRAEEMLGEMCEGFEVARVEESAHYIAEENPEGFVKVVLGFVDRHGS